ncbi:hypothetical protein Micbo1qcDRAFT_222350 [Microdochium bolleyi]|uniref:Uncharacterized protein n=1 Tax=Microdochium bolleyi TaxID=196109 RepID=A0A136J5Y8_9PEZI|nr:hypothetical protein Micbo1qcDRAFT_222350 [Microdochium bolleyi]
MRAGPAKDAEVQRSRGPEIQRLRGPEAWADTAEEKGKGRALVLATPLGIAPPAASQARILPNSQEILKAFPDLEDPFQSLLDHARIKSRPADTFRHLVTQKAEIRRKTKGVVTRTAASWRLKLRRPTQNFTIGFLLQSDYSKDEASKVGSKIAELFNRLPASIQQELVAVGRTKIATAYLLKIAFLSVVPGNEIGMIAPWVYDRATNQYFVIPDFKTQLDFVLVDLDVPAVSSTLVASPAAQSKGSWASPYHSGKDSN